MESKFKCCDVETVCGRSLWQGVVFVGIATLVISTVALLSSVAFINSVAVSDGLLNSQPMIAINLMFALVSTSISCYQIIISLLLLWHVYRIKNKTYLCSLWYISHMSILTLYCLLFTSKTVVCFSEQYYVSAITTIFLGITYQALYKYFTIVVNSYIHSLDEERYL